MVASPGLHAGMHTSSVGRLGLRKADFNCLERTNETEEQKERNTGPESERQIEKVAADEHFPLLMRHEYPHCTSFLRYLPLSFHKPSL